MSVITEILLRQRQIRMTGAFLYFLCLPTVGHYLSGNSIKHDVLVIDAGVGIGRHEEAVFASGFPINLKEL